MTYRPLAMICCFALLLACNIPAYAGFTTIINVPGDPIPTGGIGTDTQLNLFPGSTLSTFPTDFGMFGNAELNLHGGTVVGMFDANQANTINVYDGAIQGTVSLTASEPILNIYDGNVESFRSFGTVSISGGTVGDSARAGDDSMVTISGGTIGENFAVGALAKANISGGMFGDGFNSEFLSEVNLTGKQFVLDGLDITNSLTPHTPFTIAYRDVTLSGILEDGSPFSFDLNSTEMQGKDYFSPDALLTINLIPEPSGTALILTSLGILFARRIRI